MKLPTIVLLLVATVALGGDLPLTGESVLYLPDQLGGMAYPGYGDCLGIVELADSLSGKPFASGAVMSGVDFVESNTAALATALGEYFPSLRRDSLLDLATGVADGFRWRLEVYPKGGFYTCRVVGIFADGERTWFIDFAATASRAEAIAVLAKLRFE
jgi:hypothetical protein